MTLSDLLGCVFRDRADAGLHGRVHSRDVHLSLAPDICSDERGLLRDLLPDERISQHSYDPHNKTQIPSPERQKPVHENDHLVTSLNGVHS